MATADGVTGTPSESKEESTTHPRITAIDVQHVKFAMVIVVTR